MSIEKYNNCQICGENNPPENHYYFVHKTSIKNYYEKYFPKKDLYSGEKLLFKNLDSYIFNDFTDKHNLKKYLESCPLSEKQRYCKNLLLKRKELKNLVYTMTEVETKSIQIPSVAYLLKLFKDIGGYYKICEKLGFKNKYIEPKNIVFKEEDKDKNIIIDSREQAWLKVNHPYEIGAIKYGDYSINEKIYFERKSISDFISTLSGGYDRFSREIEKCGADNNFLVILVEESLSKCLVFNKLPWVNKNIKASSEFIWHRVREIIQKYNFCQFLFSDGRVEAARLVKKLLFNEEIVKNYDLQLLYSKGML